MCDVTCFLLLVMGCRSTKPHNSVADDAVKEQVALNDGKSLQVFSSKYRMLTKKFIKCQKIAFQSHLLFTQNVLARKQKKKKILVVFYLLISKHKLSFYISFSTILGTNVIQESRKITKKSNGKSHQVFIQFQVTPYSVTENNTADDDHKVLSFSLRTLKKQSQGNTIFNSNYYFISCVENNRQYFYSVLLSL